MFASFLTKRIADKAMTEHPVLLSDYCVNMTRQNSSCANCEDICEKNVFSEYEPRFDRCTNCNLCLAVCPTQAIMPPAFFLRRIIRYIETEKDKVYVACRKRDGPADVNLYCLASLPWELYATLALNKIVVISLAACNQCEHQEYVTALFNHIKETMGDDFCQEHFLFSETERLLSRREWFRALRKEGRIVSKHVLSSLVSFSRSPLLFREYFMKKLYALKNNEIGCSWKTPVILESCWGCGLCVSKCPNQAMNFAETDDRLQLVHIPWRCTQCGQCRQNCPESSIESWRLLERTPLYQQTIAADIQFTYCPKCRKPMKPIDSGYFCYYCSHKSEIRNC
jgi:ferredoxin